MTLALATKRLYPWKLVAGAIRKRRMRYAAANCISRLPFHCLDFTCLMLPASHAVASCDVISTCFRNSNAISVDISRAVTKCRATSAMALKLCNQPSWTDDLRVRVPDKCFAGLSRALTRCGHSSPITTYRFIKEQCRLVNPAQAIPLCAWRLRVAYTQTISDGRHV